MPTNMRCMTIIIPDEVEEQLDILKKSSIMRYLALKWCGI